MRQYRILFILILSVFCFLVAGNVLAQDSSPVAFIHATLVPMTGETVLPDHTVVIEGRWITSVGPSSSTEIPPNTRKIDCSNAFLMPGLADMHMHIFEDWLSKGTGSVFRQGRRNTNGSSRVVRSLHLSNTRWIKSC